MTDICTIGPVSIENAHLYDDSTWGFDNSATSTITPGATIVQRGVFKENYRFGIICTYDEALQLKGVVEAGEIIWMNTSDLTDNDFLQHKGWVILTGLDIDEENHLYVHCTIDYVKISDYENEYLTMDYSRGLFDGVNIDTSYTPSSLNTLLNETGSDATTNWTARCDYRANNTVSVDTNRIKLAMTADTAGTPGWGWIYCDTQTFTPPFTLEFTMQRGTRPASNFAEIYVGLCSTPITHGSSSMMDRPTRFSEINWNHTSSASKLSLRTSQKNQGTQYQYAYTTTTAANDKMAVRMIFTTDNRVKLYTDDGDTGTYTLKYYGPHNIDTINSGVYLYLGQVNLNTAAFNAYFYDIKVYNEDSVSYPNVVMMPPGATLKTTATATRTVEDGTASYYADPSTELRYQIAKADYYKGSVKLFSTNNDDSESRQVFSTGIKLTPTTTTLKNGMTRLTFDADEVIMSAWYSGAWNEMQRFDMGTSIDYIKPVFINSERVVLQINDTKWTMLRSSPVVTVEHPNTALPYVLKDTYYHDGTTTSSPGAAADITMENTSNGYYALVYNASAATYKTLFVKKDPCTIKSDSLLADEVTGIGWVVSAGSAYEAPSSIALQWYKQTRTGISLKQII